MAPGDWQRPLWRVRARRLQREGRIRSYATHFLRAPGTDIRFTGRRTAKKLAFVDKSMAIFVHEVVGNLTVPSG